MRRRVSLRYEATTSRVLDIEIPQIPLRQRIWHTHSAKSCQKLTQCSRMIPVPVKPRSANSSCGALCRNPLGTLPLPSSCLRRPEELGSASTVGSLSVMCGGVLTLEKRPLLCHSSYSMAAEKSSSSVHQARLVPDFAAHSNLLNIIITYPVPDT